MGEKDLAVAVSTPIFDEKGKVIGILSTAQSTALFSKLIGELGLNLDEKVTLIDQEGHIIYSNRFPYTREIIGYPSLGFLGKALKGEKDNVEVRDFSDQDRVKYVSFAPVEGLGWFVIVEKARSEVLRSETPFFSLIGVVALLLYGFVVLSMLRLRDRHQQIKRLEKLNQNLDDRVRERTADLETRNKDLRESEERFRILADATFEGIAITEHGRLVDANEQLVQIFGGMRSELIGKEVALLVAPEDRDRVMASIVSGAESDTEHQMFRRNGTRIIVETHGRTTSYQGRQVRITAIRDITERKQAGEALQASEEKFSKAFRNSPNAITITRLSDGKIIEGNESAYELFGYTHEEVIGKTTFELDIWANFGDRQRLLTGLASKGFIQNEEFVLQKKDKAPIYVNLSASLITIGNHQCFLCSFIDITQRKRAEDALQKRTLELQHLTETLEQRVEEKTADVERERRRLYGVLETVPTMVCLLTPDYHVAFANRSFREKFGDSGGRRCYEYRFGRAQPCEFCESYKVLKTGKPHRWEVTAPDGVGVIDAYNFPFTDVDGSPLVLEMDIDITEYRRTEAALEERTKELADVSLQLVSAQENERRRVSYDLHDNVWQTLVAIRFEMERLFSKLGREDEAVVRKRSKEVMADILGAVGKIRSMQGDLWPYVLDDIGILATIDWYCREFEKSHPGLTIQRQDGLGEDEIPSSAKIVIYRILQETLSNVEKHSQARQVTIGLLKKDHGVEFAVQDDGVGFDPQETIAERAPWGGLGLLNIKAQTELSGGSLKIESAKGRGTIVRASWKIDD